MASNLRMRRSVLSIIIFLVVSVIVVSNQPPHVEHKAETPPQSIITSDRPLAVDILNKLDIKGRAPKTNYSRDQFGSGWSTQNGCDTRNIILHRDIKAAILDESCNVISGVLDDPYTGKVINFLRGPNTSAAVQIDHVVALSDAWQKGAQQLSPEARKELANDPLELLAVDGPANQQKGDGDAATWLPSNKSFRCEYVARQAAVKFKYSLWVTQAEYDKIYQILDRCPLQTIPSID